MKYALVILVFCQIHLSFGQDYTCPKEVNFGDFIVVDSLINSKSNIQYFVSFKAFKKNNSEIIYHSDKLDILYDSLIFAKGNYFEKYPPKFYKDTIIFQFTIVPEYIDYISEQGKFLEADYTFYYRGKGNYNLDSQKIRLKYRLIKKESTFIQKFYQNNSYHLKLKRYFGNENDSSNFYAFIVNNTEKTFYIDSAKQEIKGNNFTSFKLLDLNQKDILKFPIKLPMHYKLYLAHWFKLLKRESSSSIITIFGHFENDNKLINLNDTINILFDSINGIYVTHDTYYSVYVNDISYIENIIISNYTDSIYFFKQIEIEDMENLGVSFINSDNIDFPYFLKPWSGFWFNKLKIKPKKEQKYRFIIDFYFEGQDKKIITRDLEFIINAIEKPVVSVGNRPAIDNSLAIFPNPATDYIDISTSAVMLNEVKHPVIKIYDVLGVCVLTQGDSRFRGNDRQVSEEGLIRIDVSGLAAGVYFVSIGSQVLKFVKM